ncbi:unnamed protein product, partial [Effrenium voratum]
DEDAQPRSFGVAPSPRELEQVDTDEAWTPEAAEELPVAPVSPKSPEPGVDMNKVADIRDQSVVIEGEFVPESSMVEWGWTP